MGIRSLASTVIPSVARNLLLLLILMASSGNQSDCPRLAGGTIPFIRKYSTICP